MTNEVNDDNDKITIFPLMLIRTAGLPLHWLDELSAGWPQENERGTDIAEAVQHAFDKALQALPESPLRTLVYNARRDFFQKRKMPADAFFQQLHKKKEEPEITQLIDSLNLWDKFQTTQQEFAPKYESALQANYRLLQQAAREETLQRALLFSSHDLLQRLSFFAKKSIADFNKKDRQTALSLLQYLTRASVKISPLSRLTTVGLIRGGAGTGQDDNFISFTKCQVTPNVALLPALYEILLREPAFYRALSVSLNPCVISASKGSKGNDWLYFDGEQESFQVKDPNPVTDFITTTLLENGRKMSFVQLQSTLENEVDASPEQLQHLVFELIDYGLLEWELPENGLSPGWCGGLYNFLGLLPEHPPVIVETATLLQWLRTTARSLAFQPVGEAQEIQRAAVALANDFFKKYGGTMPPISPEQIFFEDVAETMETAIPVSVVQTISKDLAGCWLRRDAGRLPTFRARLLSYAGNKLTDGQAVDFLGFCKQYFEDLKQIAKPVEIHGNEKKGGTDQKTLIFGALLQIFRNEGGHYRAVVNGLFPGGGKLFARWLHLFPAETTEHLQKWLNTSGTIAFPWQGWSNANFQPAISANNLAVPDGRTTRLREGRQILLGNLAVKLDSKGLQLIDKETNEPVILTDLGLEAPETRPPSMQVLWHLGVPYISLEAILPHRAWKEGGAYWRWAERVTFGSLILARKMWQIDRIQLEQWLNEKSDAAIVRRIRSEMKSMGIPRRFFARFIQEKPQYFDLDSPLTMLLLTKMLRTGRSPLFLTEMLPLPEQCIVQKNGLRAAELVLEFKV